MENEKEKDVQFYASTVNAWYSTRLEKDKHLLSLSSAAIALLVTLATTVGVADIKTAVMFVLSVISFLLCIICVLQIFSRNATHLEKTIHGADNEDIILISLDKVSTASFTVGMIFSLLVGLFSAIDKFDKEEQVMSDQTDQQETQEKVFLGNSFNGASKLQAQKKQEATKPEEQNKTSGSESKK